MEGQASDIRAMPRTAFALLLLVFPLAASIKIGLVSDGLRTEEFWSHSQPVTQKVQWWNTLDVAVAMCKLSASGVRAVVVQPPPRLRSLIATYSAHMQLPSVEGVLSLAPDTCSAAVHFIQQWRSFAFIYQTDTGPDQLSRVLRLLDSAAVVEAFWRSNGVHETVELVKSLPSTPLLLSVSESAVEPLISSLASLRRDLDIILLTPVVRIRKKMHPGSYRLIQFSSIDQESPSFKNLEKDYSGSTIFNHEAKQILQNFFSNINFPELTPEHLSCFNYTTGIDPQALIEVKVEDGLTGNIHFDAAGNRKDYRLDIYEEKPFDLKKIGWWSERDGLQVDQNGMQMSPTAAKAAAAPPIRVTSVMVKPFLFEGPNRKLEGYVIDFLEALMAILERPYQLQLVKDGGYGRQSGATWNGMVGELIRDEADIAVAPLTKTKEREKVVDFSKNFMTVGLNILLKRPEGGSGEKTFDSFSFLTTWSPVVWATLALLAVVVGGTCYFVSRYVGPPDRVRALESKGTDKLSPCGSFWFTAASLLARDTGIYPRTFSHRMWASLWWILCLFLTVGYVSCLSAALFEVRTSIRTTHTRKTSHELMKDVLERGSPAIGTVRSGSTTQFFLNSSIGLYQRLGRYLESDPSLLTKSYDEGVERVRHSEQPYAFIMESPGSQFHADSEPCDLLVTSGYLTTKSHAVALQKNSPYKEAIDHGVLMLMESGTLRHLYEKWWHNHSSCQDPSLDILPKVYNKSLKLSEVSGAFYVFILFVLVSLSVSFGERYLSAKRITLD